MWALTPTWFSHHSHTSTQALAAPWNPDPASHIPSVHASRRKSSMRHLYHPKPHLQRNVESGGGHALNKAESLTRLARKKSNKEKQTSCSSKHSALGPLRDASGGEQNFSFLLLLILLHIFIFMLDNQMFHSMIIPNSISPGLT